MRAMFLKEEFYKELLSILQREISEDIKMSDISDLKEIEQSKLDSENLILEEFLKYIRVKIDVLELNYHSTTILAPEEVEKVYDIVIKSLSHELDESFRILNKNIVLI